MLKRAFVAVLLVAGFVDVARASPATPDADAVPRAVREPVRLTAGASSELMGVLGPGGKALYFVSNASGTNDVVRQQPIERAPVAVSRGLGDALDPQLSPDGKRLAYLSLERDATGDVCVRGIDGEALAPETCLEKPGSAALQVMWWDDRSLAVLSRHGLHGNYVLERVPLDGGAPTSLLARNMLGLSLSPDRRWLAYVAVDKTTEDVGVTFAQRTGRGIGLTRLGDADTTITYVPRLSGVTGQVAFSSSGDYLLFAQFLNDTNRDGTIDGDDNAVIFRVSFRAAEAEPIRPGDEPEQLTSARWDCHYPAPAKEQLIASCSHEGSLDIYSLPPEGAVPHAWDDARLKSEIAAARDPWMRLLLSARRRLLADTPEKKEEISRQMMTFHLVLGEYESTVFDATNRLESPRTKAWGQLMAELAHHRSTDLSLIRGETSEQYIESERARAVTLRGLALEDPGLAQLRTLVISEIESDIGDKAASHAAFDELDLTKLADPLIMPLVAQRAKRIYRRKAERDRLLEVYRTLSTLSNLETAERLEYAQRFVEELTRGRTRDARAEALKASRARAEDGSELALLLDVETALLTLDDANQEAVRETIFAMYTQNKDPDRRRALVLATLRAAAKVGNEYLQYQFVTSWASGLRRDQAERKYGEQLYNKIVLDRAYGEGRQGALSEARGYFFGAAVATDALEAHIGFIEARHAEGGADVEHAIDEAYKIRFETDKDSPIAAFVQAYRLARALPAEKDPERHEKAAIQSSELLAKVARALPNQAQVHQVWGFVLHQRARREGSRQAAVDANRHYLLALDLSRSDERLTATLLHRLGLLQASMGNHGLALRYFRQRDDLPHVRPRATLGLHVATARSAWHTGENTLARDRLRTAEALVGSERDLRSFAPLVADRLGLALASTDDAGAALAAYQKLETLLREDGSSSPLNRVKAHLGVATNALKRGDPRAALAALTEATKLLTESDPLEPVPEVTWRRSLTDDYRYTALQYRALISGLRAEAARGLGDVRMALDATTERIALLTERLKISEADEDRLELAQAYLHRALLDHRANENDKAVDAIERGLALSAAFNQSTGSELNDVELALLKTYAELHLVGGVSKQALRRDLVGALRGAYTVLCKYRNPRLLRERFMLESYLAWLSARP